MSNRENILDAIQKLDADPKIEKLRAELAETRAAINSHELRRAEHKAIRLAQRLRTASMERDQARQRLLEQLERAEPDVLRDLRETIDRLFGAHRASDAPPPPTDTRARGRDDAGYQRGLAWLRRGESLAALRVALLNLWQAADWKDRLRSLLAEHAPHVAELKRFSIEEPVRV